ncbi:MAG: LysR family transcriptional regulator [Planctomycetota bacterium]
MDTDQLENFRCVAELGNFTRAAERLRISQPALSRSIQRLEEEMGQPLFDRKPREVELTDAGLRFQKSVEQILQIIDDTRSEIGDDGESGRIRVAAIPTVAPFLLPQMLKRFAEDYPKASIVVREDTTDHLLKACKQGEVDVAILALPVQAKYIDVQVLFDEELLLVMPRDHALAQLERISMSDVESHPFILLDEAHCLSDNITSFCRQQSFQPVVVERTSQLIMVQELVSLSHGVSMIPTMARRRDQSTDRVYRSIDGIRPTRTIAAVWNPYRFQSRLHQAFRDHLQTYANDPT